MCAPPKALFPAKSTNRHNDAFGNLLPTSTPQGSGAGQFNFNYLFVGSLGCRIDFPTGLIYMRNRWYDPALGRFIGRDPIGLAGGPNLYAYVSNNPINSSDPFGLEIPAPNSTTCCPSSPSRPTGLPAGRPGGPGTAPVGPANMLGYLGLGITLFRLLDWLNPAPISPDGRPHPEPGPCPQPPQDATMELHCEMPNRSTRRRKPVLP